MALPTYPMDPGRLRRLQYAVPQTSPNPVVGVVPDTQVFELLSVTALRIGLQAPAGKTLLGTGFLRMHYLDGQAGPGRWGDNPGLDMEIPSSASGMAMYWLPDVAVLLPAGRMHIRADGIGMSEQGDVTIHVLGWVGA
jgi:hypothetical protein